MEIKKKIRFEIIDEGQQINDALTQLFDGNITQMFNFLTGDNLSTASLNQYLRKLTLDPQSKFVRQIEQLFEKPYVNIVKTVEAQLEEVINHMSANIDLYDEPFDRDATLHICELSSQYCTDRRIQLSAEINRLILYGQVGIHDIRAFETCLKEALELNHIDLVLRGCAEIIQWNLTNKKNRDTAADFLTKRERLIVDWPKSYKSDYYRLIGHAKFEVGDYLSGINFSKRACSASEDPYKIALASLILADCYLKKLRISHARKKLQQIHEELTFLSPDILARVHLGFSKCSQANHQYVEAQNEALTAFWLIEQTEVMDHTRVDVLINCLSSCHFTSCDLIIQILKQLPHILKSHVSTEKVTFIFQSVYIIAKKDPDTLALFWTTLQNCLSDNYNGEFVTRNKAALFDLHIINFTK